MDFEVVQTLLNEKRGLDLEEYPRQAMLEDGTWVTVRPMVQEDEQGLLKFFGSLPEEERLYFNDNIIDPDVIKNWAENIDYDKVLPILAIVEDKIVGDCTLHRYPNWSWMKNTGHIAISVSPKYRKNNLTKILASEVFCQSLTTNLERVVVELVPDREDVREVFIQLGFCKEAVLEDKHLDVTGGKHDLLIMDADFALLWKGWMEHYDLASGA